MSRRGLLRASLLGGGVLAGCSTAPSGSSFEAGPPLAPIRARTDRIFDIAVCLRPFRPAGPRVDTERLGDTLVVHNYGHGGSGWSLSWGSSARAVRLAMQASPGEVAVIGCGVLGLTSALLAQRAGARVTIYAREQLPLTTSARATGEWTPDSRIALIGAAAPDFGTVWEEMARTAFKAHRNYLGLPGTPVEWIDQYAVSDGMAPSSQGSDTGRTVPPTSRLQATPPDPRSDAPMASGAGRQDAVQGIVGLTRRDHDLQHRRLRPYFVERLLHRRRPVPAGRVPVPPRRSPPWARRWSINCTGYGARALWKDETLTPVRGQIARLIPQLDVRYGLVYRQVIAVPRRDGIVVQSFEGGEMKGYGDTNETPDRAEAEQAVTTLAELFQPAPGRV